MSSTQGDSGNQGDSVGLVFPVHMWGVPGLVLRFLDRLKLDPGKYTFAFAVNAGQVSRTLIQLRNRLRSRGVRLSAGYQIVLPSNYIPWGGPPPLERQEALFADAGRKIEAAAKIISSRQAGPIEKGPLWQRILFTAIYKLSFSQIATMDRGFWTDDRCDSCGICGKVCPVDNVLFSGGKPSWKHHCEQCLACIQWCPQEALQLGKKTPAYQRYHHPGVKLKDVLVRRSA
jgi:ferredoxin